MRDFFYEKISCVSFKERRSPRGRLFFKEGREVSLLRSPMSRLGGVGGMV